ncbi:MAG: hypothetical protein EOM20_14650 [Spartobacteria bacterium]|nr:hypothetical protein [Spartobacteria bacterium]
MRHLDEDKERRCGVNCEYVRNYYGVPAQIGRRVICSGKPGVIAKDRGHYIGVNFDEDKPGIIRNVHPTDDVEYGEIGKIRSMTRSQARYQRYLDIADCFHSFRDFLAYEHEQRQLTPEGVRI